jgi:hypothetical protein
MNCLPLVLPLRAVIPGSTQLTVWIEQSDHGIEVSEETKEDKFLTLRQSVSDVQSAKVLGFQHTQEL